MTNYSKKSNGFTLIELLIYIVVIGGVAVTFISYILSVSESRNKTYVIQEVQTNVRLAMELISQQIRGADSVISPASGNTSSSLSLMMPDSTTTIIDLDANGVLQIKEGVQAAIPITSSRVQVTNLVFRNYSGASARENIGVEITVAYRNAGDIEYTYSQNLQTAVGVRQ